MKKYYTISIFYVEPEDWFYIPIEIEVEPNKILCDKDIITHAINTDLMETDEANHVDCVEEITEERYKELIS